MEKNGMKPFRPSVQGYKSDLQKARIYRAGHDMHRVQATEIKGTVGNLDILCHPPPLHFEFNAWKLLNNKCTAYHMYWKAGRLPLDMCESIINGKEKVWNRSQSCIRAYQAQEQTMRGLLPS